MDKNIIYQKIWRLFWNRYQWMIGFAQGVRNHFVLKKQFTKLGYNSIEVNCRKKKTNYIETIKKNQWFYTLPTFGLCPVLLQNLQWSILYATSGYHEANHRRTTRRTTRRTMPLHNSHGRTTAPIRRNLHRRTRFLFFFFLLFLCALGSKFKPLVPFALGSFPCFLCVVGNG